MSIVVDLMINLYVYVGMREFSVDNVLLWLVVLVGGVDIECDLRFK